LHFYSIFNALDVFLTRFSY